MTDARRELQLGGAQVSGGRARCLSSPDLKA
jgi:hypothetical protein